MNRLIYLHALLILFSTYLNAQEPSPVSNLNQVTHKYANNGDVKLHYVTVGEGPLVVMLHGFPDYWYTWRHQMDALKNDFQVVAMDLRGYNLSDQPEGVDAYAMTHLMNDVVAVIKSTGQEKAIVVGHDWGGAIAWQVAINHPEVVERLIVCNMTHPTGHRTASIEALQTNGNTSYMDEFRKHTAETLPVSWMCGWVTDTEAKPHYEEALGRSSVDGMINFYRANTQTKAQRAKWLENPIVPEVPKVNVPVLAIFGTQDKYVSKRGLNNTWDWLGGEFTLVTIPTAGHFVQQDASDRVSQAMKQWLIQPGEPERESAEQLAKLDWILGTWSRNRGEKTVIEQWTQLSANTFQGHTSSKSADQVKNRALEDILITVMGDDVFYLPKPAESAFPTPFKLVACKDGQAVFENPKHDFPQRIEYQKTDDGQLKAIISNLDRSNEIEFVFEKEN